MATPVLDYLLDATELHSSCVGRLSRSGTCRGSNPQVPNLQIEDPPEVYCIPIRGALKQLEAVPSLYNYGI